ncbi:DNA/RNA non-specific endonuclease [Lacinutrix neustonica]|uniref:DNA/RNA non-specific endonuclease n=1 Tax=Lacinutrix neustonica TaxID=2980107 RepID=UPI0028BDCF65|nr:DNA/RNA non-specific endonuclease [Lacinutrix neustonica]
MSKKTLYSILAALLLIAVYSYNLYSEKEIERKIMVEGASTKTNTNAYFLPTSTTGQIIHHEGYSLSYSEPHEQAEWVAYELKQSHLSPTNFQRPYFEVDRAVKTTAAHWQNYKNSGYDRGHLCPAADRAYSQFAFNETFLTSNISPQTHEFNAGVWNRLEQQVRDWALEYDGVFVISGGILKGDMKTIGDEKVSVPNQFYKVLIDHNSGQPKLLAFLINHQESNKSLNNFVVSVDAVEALTGIDFFP